ncbi:two-component system sensor histidine kinase EvgS [Paraburkholderia sp. GAS199]|uniref:transporter substrate-binding domain-containing protein n=1 Tax=Paraburkholderia sp. GAS199 TaxID=3035126 RepID=UPI003D23C44A
MKFQSSLISRFAFRRLIQWLLLTLALSFVQSLPAMAQPFSNASAQQITKAFPATLTVGVLADGWMPFESLQNGRLTGLSADYLRAMVGPKVTIEAKPYPDVAQLFAAACAGKVDLVMSVARMPGRERCFSFSAPYMRATASVVTRRDGKPYEFAYQLAGARIAVEQGFAQERSLRERFPHAQIKTFVNTRAALQAVAQDEADAYFGFTPAVQYILDAENLRDLHVAFEESGRISELRFAVPRDASALRDQLDRALASMSPAEISAIRARWLSGGFNTQVASSRLVLTPQEQAWLATLPPLQVGFDNHWAPFSYIDDSGHPAGIAAEYLEYLSHTLGVTFTRAHTTDWPAAIESFRRGELALLATSSNKDSRLNNARYTQAYESYPLVIVGREDEPAAHAISDFASRRIVISSHIAGSIPHVLEKIPPDHLIVAASLDDGLKMVVGGQADVLVGNVAAVDILLQQRYAGTLKILSTVGGADALGFAVRADLEPLAGLIDRALIAMPAAEKQRIRQKWVAASAADAGTWSVTAVRLLPVLIAIGIVLLVTLRAYLLLQREVRLRKQTERELALQLNFQETMMEMVPYPLVARDLEGRYIAVNRAYEEACGLSRQTIIGRSAWKVRAWGDANSLVLHDLTQDMLNSGGPAEIELEFQGTAGDLRHGLFWNRVCHGPDGKASCVLATVVDITDIRRAEMRARETERRLFDVTRSLPAVVFQLRRSADGIYSFPYVGGDTQPLLGDSGASLTAREEVHFGRVCAEDRAFVLAELDRSARCASPVHMEFRYQTVGDRRWTRAELVPRRENDGGVVWSGYWVDASVEHARSEELARARDEAEAASRAKDDFLAMMSHEIRTPMNGVLGLVEVLERTPLNADQGEMLSMIHESAGALLQILDDLLDFSKIEAGRLTIEAEPIDIRELVDNAVGLLAGRAHEKGLKVRVDIEPNVAATLRGDSVRLRQILFNLLGNAIKFTPQGEVDVRVALVGESADGQVLEMTVEDTGIGIAPEVQARLFEPFVQAETSTTRRFGGTGLGLTICRKLIDLMNGTLQLHSEPQVGTRMTVRLSMPVESQRNSVSGLLGKRGIVSTADVRVGRALMHFGQALGLDLRSVPPGSPEFADPATFADADMIFVAEDATLPSRVKPASRIICLTEKAKPTGYRILDHVVRVSVNPISWRGLGAACAAAMTGLPSVVPSASRKPRVPDNGAVPPDRERAIASGRLILVAEDHPVNQELIRHQLALLGFACDVANDGLEALAALERTSYGCLITDCHMPNLSGYELARRIREREQGGAHRLPILAITANTAPEDLNLCREAGMDDSLVKPTRLATLRDYLSRWFGADSAWQAAPAETVGASSTQETAGADSGGAVEPFVPVDLGHMTQLWGSESTVKALLDSFVSSVREDVQGLAPLLDQPEAARLREWHHRVAGAASVLQYPPLLKALEDYRRDMDKKTPERLRIEGMFLARKCNAMLDGIEEQAALLA